jgi:Zn finger protein HypA/HybF involved in hydrogenase expression
MLKKITVIKDGYKCERCSYEWASRKVSPERLPKCCPRCNSPYWNSPRKNKIK